MNGSKSDHEAALSFNKRVYIQGGRDLVCESWIDYLDVLSGKNEIHGFFLDDCEDLFRRAKSGTEGDGSEMIKFSRLLKGGLLKRKKNGLRSCRR